MKTRKEKKLGPEADEAAARRAMRHDHDLMVCTVKSCLSLLRRRRNGAIFTSMNDHDKRTTKTAREGSRNGGQKRRGERLANALAMPVLYGCLVTGCTDRRDQGLKAFGSHGRVTGSGRARPTPIGVNGNTCPDGKVLQGTDGPCSGVGWWGQNGGKRYHQQHLL